MGQFLHGSAKTTHAVRAELQRSKAPVAALARRAIASRATVEAKFDLSRGRIDLDEEGFVIRYPDAMQFRLQTGQYLVKSGERGSIAFYSDGSSSGGTVEFKLSGHTTSRIEVPWLTGIP